MVVVYGAVSILVFTLTVGTGFSHYSYSALLVFRWKNALALESVLVTCNCVPADFCIKMVL